MPVTIQNVPLMAVIMGGGDAENSFSISCQARAVHRRKAFHADKVNTNQYSRVTRKGRLFIVYVCKSVCRSDLRVGNKNTKGEISPNILVFQEDT